MKLLKLMNSIRLILFNVKLKQLLFTTQSKWDDMS